jgi:esterase/lipase
MDKRRNTILLLHGALGTSKDLSALSDHLKERGHETLSFDFSGHGPDAAWPAEFRIDLFARDLEHYLKSQNLKDVAVFGYSMGGYVALYHKANFEDSPIANVVTYGTKFNWSPKAVAKELPLLDPDHLQEKYPHFAEALKTKHGERWKQLMRSTAHMMQHLERLDGLTKEDLHEVEIPVTLVLGDQDRMVTSEETNLTASWLHHVQVKTLTHSKHELERSNLKELAEIIVSASE